MSINKSYIFLYDDYLVIQNKLTDRIIHSQKLLKPFKDMYMKTVYQKYP
jgi:hypothetical protein